MGEYFNETDLCTFKMGYCLGMAGFNLILIFVPQHFSCLLEQKETFCFVLFSKRIRNQALDGFLTFCFIPLHGCVLTLKFLFLNPTLVFVGEERQFLTLLPTVGEERNAGIPSDGVKAGKH